MRGLRCLSYGMRLFLSGLLDDSLLFVEVAMIRVVVFGVGRVWLVDGWEWLKKHLSPYLQLPSA